MSASRHPHVVLDRLCQVTGLNDAGLAKVLGVEATILGRWRRQGSQPVPTLVHAVVTGRLDVDLHWLLTGQTARRLYPVNHDIREFLQ